MSERGYEELVAERKPVERIGKYQLVISLDHPAERILAEQVERLGLTPAQVIGRALTLYSIACATVPAPPVSKGARGPE